jgi:thymidine kinase
VTATLRWHFGPMNAGKSTLALQLDYNLRACGREGVRFTRRDRSGAPVISSRLGISADAVEVTASLDLAATVEALLATDCPITYVIADEAQFYSLAQVEQLADIVDHLGIPVSAFGIATDFASDLFPGSRRLFEIADEHVPLQVQAMCWCGETARMNARIVNGVMVTEGEQVVVGDTTGEAIRYVLLCRRHFRARRDKPAPVLIKDQISAAA